MTKQIISKNDEQFIQLMVINRSASNTVAAGTWVRINVRCKCGSLWAIPAQN